MEMRREKCRGTRKEKELAPKIDLFFFALLTVVSTEATYLEKPLVCECARLGQPQKTCNGVYTEVMTPRRGSMSPLTV